jgi:hypothetical protein
MGGIKLRRVLPAREWVVLKSNECEVSGDHGDMPKPRLHIGPASNSPDRCTSRESEEVIQ